jgi:hypothetical protein
MRYGHAMSIPVQGSDPPCPWPAKVGWFLAHADLWVTRFQEAFFGAVSGTSCQLWADSLTAPAKRSND